MSAFPPESVAFVTGGASGIGLGSCKILLKDGITKLAVVDYNLENLSTATTELKCLFPSVEILAIHANICVEAEINDAVAKTVEKFGRLDFCCNSAGVTGSTGLIADMEVDNFDLAVGTNARGTWLTERAQIRQMMKQELRPASTGIPSKTRGAIVNIGSLSGQVAIPHMNPYVISKHAIQGLTKADAIDYAQLGIRVNCLQPGPVKTPLMALFFEGDLKPLGDAAIGRAPMNRWADVEEIAHVVSFLLSDKASFVTGATWNVDGGYGAM